MADDQTFHDDIEAYCGRLSCVPGDALGLHVSTRRDPFDVRVERWGASRDMVWETHGSPGTYIPPPPDADAEGCRWPVSIEIPVGAAWASGFYLVTLTAHGAAPGRDV